MKNRIISFLERYPPRASGLEAFGGLQLTRERCDWETVTFDVLMEYGTKQPDLVFI